MARRPTRFTPTIGGALDDAPGWLRAALAALEAASVSLVLMVLPVFLVWAASPNITVGGWRAVQLGLAGWCLAHGGALSVRIGTLSLLPLLFTVISLAIATWSAGRLSAGLARAAPGRLSWARGLRRDVAVEGSVFVGLYTVLGVLAALLARTPDFTASLPRALLGFLAMGLAAYVLGLRSEFRADLGDVASGWQGFDRLPAWARAGWRTGWRILAWLLLLGLLLVVFVAVVRFDRIAGLYDALSPGILGGVVLTTVQTLYAPNLAVWALSWMAGPGFGIGTDSSITLTTAEPGLLPLIPVFGALPEPGPLPAVVRMVLVLPIAAGFFLERRSARMVGTDPLDRALAAASGCVVAGLGAVLLGFAAGGSLGSARLAVVGPPAFLLGAMLGGELALGAALSLAIWLIRRSVRGDDESTAGPPERVPATVGRPEWPTRRG